VKKKRGLLGPKKARLSLKSWGGGFVKFFAGGGFILAGAGLAVGENGGGVRIFGPAGVNFAGV